MKYKHFFILLGISLFLSLIIAPLRGGYVSIGSISGLYLSSIIGFILYGILTYSALIKLKWKLTVPAILLSIIGGIILLPLPIHIMNWQGTLGSLLECLIHISAVLWAYALYKSKSSIKIITGIISIVFCFWISTDGYSMWIHKLNHGTFTGNVRKEKVKSFLFTNEEGDSISNKDFQGKYIVLDFWYKRCGYCFKAFPQVEELYQMLIPYADEIELYAVNYKLEEDSDEYAFKTIQKAGYSFPVLRTDDNDMLKTVFEVSTYPVVFIIDKEGNKIFRGDIENATEFVKEIIKDL